MQLPFKKKPKPAEAPGQPSAPEALDGEEMKEKHVEAKRPAEVLREILRKRQQPELKRSYPKFQIAPSKFVPLPPETKEAVYPLIRPFAYASIKFDKKEGALVYKVVEPQLTAEETRIYSRLKEGLVQLIDVPLSSIKNEEALLKMLEEKIARLLDDYAIRISDDQYFRIMYFVYRDFIGLNELEPFLRDPYIEDVSCLPSFEKVLVRKFGKLQLVEIGKLIDGELGPGDDTKIAKPSDIDVLSFDPQTFKTSFKPAEAIIRRANKEGLFIRIRAEGGNYINTSPDHPVLVLTESGITTKLAQEVKEDDYLLSLKTMDMPVEDATIDLIDSFADSDIDIRVRGAKDLLGGNKVLAEKLGVKWYDVSNWKQSDSMPLRVYLKLEDSRERRKRLQISGGQGVKNWMPAIIKVDETFAEFTGLFLAEGYFGNSNMQFSFGKHEKELCERVAEMARRMFNCTSKLVERETSLVVYCGGKVLQALFEKVLGCGRDSYTRRVPDLFYETSESMRKALIRGVWLGDGYVRCDDRVNKAVLATASPELAWGVRFLLKTLGVSTHLHARNRKFANTWEVSVEHGSSLEWIANLLGKPMSGDTPRTQLSNSYPNFLFNINDYQGMDRKLLRNALRAGNRLGLKLALKSQSQMLHRILNGNIHPTKVIGTETVEYSGPFYDFKVESHSNFMHGDFVFTHNCDGNRIPIYIIHQKFGQLKTNVVFEEDVRLRDFVVKLAERCDRYVSYAEPLLDGTLPDGTRVQASLAGDVTTHGPTFSIRKFKERPFTPVDMLRLGTVDLDILAYLWFVVENGSNMIVVGATATGKTSFLNSLAFFMPQEAKVVSIEDTRELRIEHENWIPGVARLGFSGTKVGEVSMFDLLKEAFRQNPNYLIVGEVRGEEASVMFQAMASGITSMSTMHAGSVEDALKRLQTRPISLPPTLMETLDVMVIMARAVEKGASARRVRNIIEIESVDPATNEVKYVEAFGWDPAKDTYHKKKESILFKKIAQEKGLTVAGIEKDIQQRRQFLKWLASQEMDWKKVAEYLVLYKRNKAKAIELMKSGF